MSLIATNTLQAKTTASLDLFLPAQRNAIYLIMALCLEERSLYKILSET